MGIGQILYDTKDTVIGIATNDMGVAKDGSKKQTFQRGVELKGTLSLSLSLSHTHTHTHTHTQSNTLYKISEVGNLSPRLCYMAHMLSLDVVTVILDSSSN